MLKSRCLIAYITSRGNIFNVNVTYMELILHAGRHAKEDHFIQQNMGIPNFYSAWLARHDRDITNSTSIIIKNVPPLVSSFSIDMNGLIHSAAQKTYAYGEHENKLRQEALAKLDPITLEVMFFSNVTNELSRVVEQCRPIDLLVMAVDGVAPRSKINQQRSRRYKSSRESNGKGLFNSSVITPGTDLMNRLDLHLQQFILDAGSNLPPKVIYSSHRIPGEGEHKIMDLMRDGETYTTNSAHLLYGLDADLIMLSLLVPIRGIHLIREDLRDIVRIDSVRILVEDMMTPGEVEATEDTYRDFVLLSYFIGNDFLPHMPSMEDLGKSFDLLLRIYREVATKSITNGREIDWLLLGSLLSEMAIDEPVLLKMEANRSIKYPSPMLQSSMKRSSFYVTPTRGSHQVNERRHTEKSELDFDLYRSKWYDNALLPKQPIPVGEVTIESISKMCRSYLTGIAWIFNYYQGNFNAVDIDWYYPYYYTPLFTDLADYLLGGGTINDISPKELPYSPIHQLLAVIPKSSIDILPWEVHHLLDLSSPIVDMYPSDFLIDLEGKNYEHQGIALLPFVDMDRIVEAVNKNVVFSPERIEVYSEGQLMIVEMTEAQLKNRTLRRRIETTNTRGRGRGGNRGASGDSRGRGAPRGRRGNRGTSGDNRGRGGYRGRGASNYRGNSQPMVSTQGGDIPAWKSKTLLS